MHLNDRQKLVLLGVLEDQQRLLELPCGRDIGFSHDEVGRRRVLVRHAIDGLVPMNLADWIGRAPTNSDCVLFHREYQRLEAMGLLERINLYGGRRTSHLRLTSAGRRVAKQLWAQETGTEGEAGDDNIDWSTLELEPIEMPAEAAE